MPVDVVVVIVTYNSEGEIGRLMETLGAGLGELTAEVIVVDNGSTDDTMQRLAEYQHVRVIASTNVGYAAAINLAVERSDPTAHIVILNPDTRVRADALHTLLNGLHDPAVGIVAPRLVEPDGSTQKSLRREPTILRALGLTRTRLPLLSEYVHDQRAYQTQTDADWAVGAALLVRRECFADLGGWDSSYFLYSEETDFCLRARDRGWLTRLQPTAIVEHIGGGSGRSARTHTMQVINRVRLYRRRNPPLSSWLYYLVTLLNEATRIIRPGDRGRSRAAVLALLRPLRRPAELGCSDRLMPC